MMQKARQWWKWFAMETGHPVMAAIVIAVLLIAGPCVLVVGMMKALDTQTFSASGR